MVKTEIRWGFVPSLNLKRRHLSPSQLAMVGAWIAQLPKSANQHVEISTPSQTEVAGSLNVSRESIIHVRKVLDRAEPEVVAAVEQGNLTVSAAAKLADKPAKLQLEAAKRVEEYVAEGRTAAEATQVWKTRFELV